MRKYLNVDHIKPWHVLGIFVLFISLGFLCSWGKDRTFAVPKNQNPASQPIYGWMVKEDLDVGQVPGGPIAQRFLVRELSGWEILAYCLDPDDAPPPVGTS